MKHRKKTLFFYFATDLGYKKNVTLSQHEEKGRGKKNVGGGHDRQGASDQVIGAGLFCLERHLSINNQ